VEDCLTKDPQVRISANQILHKHKKFFSKSQGRTYIKKNLLEGLAPLKDRIPKKTQQIGEQYFNEKYELMALNLGVSKSSNTLKKKGSHKVVWKFSEDWDADTRTKPSSSKDFSLKDLSDNKKERQDSEKNYNQINGIQR